MDHNLPSLCSFIVFKKVGQHVAEFINYMLNRDETSFSASDFHIVGFSLGAQVAGKAGAVLNGLGKNLARITGLDPAGLYKKEPISNIFHLCSLTFIGFNQSIF